MADENLPKWRRMLPWYAKDILWGLQAGTLSVVSAYYTTNWTLAQGFPIALSPSVFVAVEVSALISLIVLKHPANRFAWWSALLSVIFSALLAATINALEHGLGLGIVHVTSITVLSTGFLIPLMLVISSHVASGMKKRPPKEDAEAKATISAPVPVVAPQQAPPSLSRPFTPPAFPVAGPAHQPLAQRVAAAETRQVPADVRDPEPVVRVAVPAPEPVAKPAPVRKERVVGTTTSPKVSKLPTSYRDYIRRALERGDVVTTADLRERYPDAKPESLRSALSVLKTKYENGKKEDRSGRTG